MLLEFGRAGLIGKARQQPERVLLLDRLRTDGLAPVLEAAFNKLDEPLPLGYASVGRHGRRRQVRTCASVIGSCPTHRTPAGRASANSVRACRRR